MPLISADDDCVHILYQAWYLDNGTLAGKKSAILHALSLLDSIGPALGIFVNLSKCEVFCKGDTSNYLLSPLMYLTLTYLVLLQGITFSMEIMQRSEALKLLSRLVEVGVSDPQVALILL